MAISETDLGTLFKALAYAAHKHKDQRRKDVSAPPYINHPIALATILCNEARHCDVETLCGALLHDTLEDTDTTPEDLHREFGATICAIVQAVSDDQRLPKADCKRLQIEHAAQASDQAKRVKLADKIANLRDMADHPPAGWSLERRQEYFDWCKAVIDRLRGVDPVLEALFDAAYARRPK
ncbi:MAG: HD domain-containing protein [Thiohalobacteraceae bacterium]